MNIILLQSLNFKFEKNKIKIIINNNLKKIVR